MKFIIHELTIIDVQADNNCLKNKILIINYKQQ